MPLRRLGGGTSATSSSSRSGSALIGGAIRRRRSVARLVDEAVLLDPRHHRAELLADDLDRMLGHQAAPRHQRRRTGAVLDDEALGVLAALDVLEHLLHRGAGLLV